MNNIPYKRRGFPNFSAKRKNIIIFFLITAVLSAAFTIMALNAKTGWNIWTFFPLIYFSALFIITYNLENLKRILRKAYKPLIFIFYFGMIAFAAVFSIFCFLILRYTSENIPENPDLIIVLGCQVYGDIPSIALKSRLDTAINVLNEYPETICIVSGGQGPDETVPEAATMKKYLSDKVTSPDRIYAEIESHSSFTNLLNSKQITDENNLNCENIIIITNEYHVPRSVLIANRVYSDSTIYAVKANSPFTFFTVGIIREFFAYVKSFVADKV